MFNVEDKRVKIRKLEDDLSNVKINYVNDLDAINVTILNTSNLDKLTSYIPELVMATWNENIDEFNDNLTNEDREKFVFRALQGKFIPTCLESINITFKIEGITWHDVSHLIRHHGFAFAADCSGDKIIENRAIAKPEFIDELQLFEEYNDAMKKLMHIYNVAINNNVHIQDARLMLPRTMTTFYYVTGSLNTCIKFIRQRIDRQVQPKSDNIVAMQLLLKLCEYLPALTQIITPDIPNIFYINETQTNFASKWELPLEQNKKKLENIKLNKNDFIYENGRDTLIGNKYFVELWTKYTNKFYSMKNKYYASHKDLVDDCTTGDWR